MPPCMRVFFDTEFNGWRDESRLLSIGFAAEDGRDCYFELPPRGAHLAGADEFVISTVVGQFNRIDGSQVLSLAEMARRVALFLQTCGARPELHYDYKLDWRHLESLLSLSGGSCKRAQIHPVDSAGWMKFPGAELACDSVLANFRTRGLGRHHALVDACMMRASVLQVDGTTG